jgi:hypothetical protein
LYIAEVKSKVGICNSQKTTLEQVIEKSQMKCAVIQGNFPQKWTSGDAQLVFPEKTKLEMMLLRKNERDKVSFR